MTSESHVEKLKKKLVVWCYECEEFVYFKDLKESKWRKLTHFLCPKCDTALDQQGTVLLQKDVLPVAEKLDKAHKGLDLLGDLVEKKDKRLLKLGIKNDKLEARLGRAEKLLKKLQKEMKDEITNGWAQHDLTHWNDYLREEVKPYLPILHAFLKHGTLEALEKAVKQ